MVATTPLQTLLIGGVLASTAASVQFINAVWSTGDFSTISGPSGNEHGHFTGFNLTDENGESIYSVAAPNDYSPCQMEPYTFTLSGGCFAAGQQYEFQCKSEFSGTPEHCVVLDSSSNVIAEADGDSDITFIGIAISTSGYCGASFALGDSVSCLPNSEGFVVS